MIKFPNIKNKDTVTSKDCGVNFVILDKYFLIQTVAT